MSAVIEVERLTKLYGSLAALRDVSFRVEQGEIVGFLGPNGAGKTTTLRILTCFIPPTSGFARIAGLDCREHPLEVRGKIGYLPETISLYSDMTVRRFLAFAASAKGVPRSRRSHEVERVLARCSIKEVENRIIGHLSKGYRQRLGIAQALINDPPILILDEPTIGLDPAQIVEIRTLIKELAGERTIILSSHILPEVSQVCQRVLVINRGQIVATDTPANLTGQLRRTLQLRLQIEGPDAEIREELVAVDGVLRVQSGDGPASYLVETDRHKDVRPELARRVVARGWQLKELRTQELSLEEIFMELVTEEGAREEIK
ncbi:MAG TPA: ABC transporter ATP-binding protein [Syntrophobacteria bacterium]|nr:ABC transporter ATP-binding protein [Syntrophobacteria bacterium]